MVKILGTGSIILEHIALIILMTLATQPKLPSCRLGTEREVDRAQAEPPRRPATCCRDYGLFEPATCYKYFWGY